MTKHSMDTKKALSALRQAKLGLKKAKEEEKKKENKKRRLKDMAKRYAPIHILTNPIVILMLVAFMCNELTTGANVAWSNFGKLRAVQQVAAALGVSHLQWNTKKLRDYAVKYFDFLCRKGKTMRLEFASAILRCGYNALLVAIGKAQLAHSDKVKVLNAFGGSDSYYIGFSKTEIEETKRKKQDLGVVTESYKDSVKSLLTIFCNDEYAKFSRECERIHWDYMVVSQFTDMIKAGDRNAIAHALEHGGIGNCDALATFPIRCPNPGLPRFRQWNNLPISKRVAGFISGPKPKHHSPKQKPLYPVSDGFWETDTLVNLAVKANRHTLHDRRLNSPSELFTPAKIQVKTEDAVYAMGESKGTAHTVAKYKPVKEIPEVVYVHDSASEPENGIYNGSDFSDDSATEPENRSKNGTDLSDDSVSVPEYESDLADDLVSDPENGSTNGSDLSSDPVSEPENGSKNGSDLLDSVSEAENESKSDSDLSDGDMFHSNLVNAEFYADDFDQLHGGADDFDVKAHSEDENGGSKEPHPAGSSLGGCSIPEDLKQSAGELRMLNPEKVKDGCLAQAKMNQQIAFNTPGYRAKVDEEVEKTKNRNKVEKKPRKKRGGQARTGSSKQSRTSKSSSNSLAKDNKTDGHFQAKCITATRISKGKREYLVQWAGYSRRESTWEPTANILDKDLIKDFKNGNKS